MSKNSKLLNDPSKDNDQRENPQSGKSGIENQLPPIAADPVSQLKTNSLIAPAGLTGKSKQLSDHFYKLTHGAINPVSTVRISRSQLMSGSGIRSLQTFYKCLNDLILRGLVKKSVIGGEQDGNIYQVFVLAEPDPAEHQSDPGDPIHPSQKSVDPVPEVAAAVPAGSGVNEPTNDLGKFESEVSKMNPLLQLSRYEIKPLDENEREEIMKILVKFATEQDVRGLQMSYTLNDWCWLLNTWRVRRMNLD